MDIIHRPRRTRTTTVMRDLVAETHVDPRTLIMPHFVCEGTGVRTAIESMPGIDRVSIDNMLRDMESDLSMGIKSILLFGIPETKDPVGSEAYNDNGITQRAVREIKKRLPEVLVVTDVCMCEYTSHGHCGIIEGDTVCNDRTLDLLCRTALSHARAGADVIAPSDMMDGRVGAIREALDYEDFTGKAIMAYSAKYASAFYGPFREAAGSTPQFGDRRAYQMDPRNAREAEKEIMLDMEEGADIVMVKPALAYLDIIYRARQVTDLPLCAYNVSGEYSMVKASASLGYIDEQRIVTEIMTAIYRAGADMVISYHTRDIFKNNWL